MSSAAKDLERHAANKKAAKAVKEAIPLYNPGKGRGNVPHLLKKSSSDDAGAFARAAAAWHRQPRSLAPPSHMSRSVARTDTTTPQTLMKSNAA